jgi:isopentenyl-diphosphate delta-isomerase
VGVLFILAAGAFFMVNVPMPAWSHYLSGLNVVLFAVPAFWAAVRWLGRRDAVLLFVVLGALAIGIETLAIATGFPYGHFGYSDLLGYRLFGYTPWTVALAWTPLVVAAYAVARRTMGSAFVRVIVIALLLTSFDLVIDPGAVKLGFWQYLDGGTFYGVPNSNFVGWVFSGVIAGIVVEVFAVNRNPLLPVPVQLISSGFFIVIFWSFISLWAGMVAPALIGLVLIVGFTAYYVRYHYAFDDMIVLVDENDRPTGTARKLAAHHNDTQRHRAFSVFLFSKDGNLLLQQRALSKKTWPGVWSNSCCGHVMLHEKVVNAARRRLKYELGIKISDLNVVLPDFRYSAEKDGVVENELCPVLVGFMSVTLRPNPYEVHDTRWVDWNKFLVDVRDPSNGFSPWAVEETELLANSQKFQDLYHANIAAPSSPNE